MDSSRIPFSTRAKNLTGALNLNSLSVTNGITATTITASGEMNANSLSVTNGIAAKDITTTGLIQGYNLHASAGITGTTITASAELNANSLSVTNGIATTDITATGLVQGLNLLASANITATGSNSILSVASGNDTTHTLGMASIGNLGFNDDSTGIKHKDQPLSSYALLQGADGTIYSSSGIGKTHVFKTAHNTSGNTEWMVGSNAGVTITPALTVNDSITQNFDIITSATWSDYHLIPMFHSTSDGTYYSGVAKKSSFTRDDNSRYVLRYKPVDTAYGGYGTLYTNTFAAYTFASLSDNRLKHNEKKIKNGLDVIRRLEPQEYQKTGEMLAPDYNGDISGEWHYEAGFIAQEIKQIPEISYSVLGGDTIKESGEIVPEPYSVNYNNIFTYGIASIKELDAIVSTQATLIKKLEERLYTLENK